MIKRFYYTIKENSEYPDEVLDLIIIETDYWDSKKHLCGGESINYSFCCRTLETLNIDEVTDNVFELSLESKTKKEWAQFLKEFKTISFIESIELKNWLDDLNKK